MDRARKPVPRPADHNIVKRRAREDALAANVLAVVDTASAVSKAQWDDKHLVAQKNRRQQATVQLFQQEQESDLLRRKRRLAALLNDEFEEWKNEAASRIETNEQKRDKMVQRALELKTQREARRVEFVKQQFLYQQRLSCDDLRMADSHELTMTATRSREAQLKEKEARLKEEKEFEARMAIQWEEDRLAKEARHRKDLEDLAQRNAVTKKMLDEQGRAYRTRLVGEQKEEEEAARQQLAEWRLENERVRQAEQQARADAAQKRLENQAFNRMKRNVQADLLAHERANDKKLLDLALEQERANENAELQAKEEHRRQMMLYQEHLQRQMARQAEDYGDVMRLLKEREDEVQAKQDAQAAREAAAKKRLERDVYATMGDQVRERRRLTELERLADEQQAKLDAEEAARLLAEERRRVEEAKNKRLTHAETLKMQIDGKRAAEAKRAQDTYLEVKYMAKAEREYQNTVQRLALVKQPLDHRRKTAQWMYD